MDQSKTVLFRLASVIALAGLATVPAAATVVYDNTNAFVDNFDEDAFPIDLAVGSDAGAVDGFSSYAATDEFALPTSGSIQSIALWLWECNDSGPDGTCGSAEDLTSLHWAILNNNGTTHYPYDGTVVASGTENTPGTYLKTNGMGYAVFDESFNIGSVALSGATHYWLIIDDAQTTSGNTVAWDQSDGPTTAYDLVSGSPIDLTANCNPDSDLYPGTTCTETFQLSGSLLGGTAVPEPGTVLLFAGGLVGLVLARRKFPTN